MYRTARAHPPSRCQVSFPLTLHLAPDLTGTRCACLFVLPLLLLHTCAYVRTHAHHTLTRIEISSHSRPKRSTLLPLTRLSEYPALPKSHLWHNVIVKRTTTPSLTHMMIVQVCYFFSFCTPHTFQLAGAGNILPWNKERTVLQGSRWGISLAITAGRAAFEYFISKSELWDDAEVWKYDVWLLAWEKASVVTVKKEVKVKFALRI